MLYYGRSPGSSDFYSPSRAPAGDNGCVNKCSVETEPELQLREQPPVLTGFPFNPDRKIEDRNTDVNIINFLILQL